MFIVLFLLLIHAAQTFDFLKTHILTWFKKISNALRKMIFMHDYPPFNFSKRKLMKILKKAFEDNLMKCLLCPLKLIKILWSILKRNIYIERWQFTSKINFGMPILMLWNLYHMKKYNSTQNQSEQLLKLVSQHWFTINAISITLSLL